ncbi:MAG: hypothetical protein ACTS73_07220 [Arsenophonus sp. NEOnobi-MAG3]
MAQAVKARIAKKRIDLFFLISYKIGIPFDQTIEQHWQMMAQWRTRIPVDAK